MMQGVALPAGDYRLDFRYRPRDVLWGGVISGLSWLSLVCGGVWMGGARRPRAKRSMKMKPDAVHQIWKSTCASISLADRMRRRGFSIVTVANGSTLLVNHTLEPITES